MTAEANQSGVGLRLEQHHAACHIILDRPRAMNALSIAMKDELSKAIPGLARDAETYAVIIKSADPRAFCVGGDVKELVGLAATDLEAAHRSLADEYRLNWVLECFFKPTVAFIDGAVMGSGVGLTQYGTHIVAAENYRFAMPETAIGFFPDVGMAHKLAQLPHAVGVYLALTGRTIGRADAYALGLVTHCIAASELSDVADELADAQPIDPVLDRRHEAPGDGDLQPYLEGIAAAFSKPTLSEIFDSLAELGSKGSPEQQQWFQAVSKELKQKSPVALHVTLRHVRQSAQRDLRETLMADYHLACRFIAAADLHEGVRAMLIDKTKDPTWQHDSIDKVTLAEVEAYFERSNEAEFELPSKQLMESK